MIFVEQLLVISRLSGCPRKFPDVIPKELATGVTRKLRLLPEGRQRPELIGVTGIKENSTGQARNRPLHKVRICQHRFIIHTTFSSNSKVDKLDLDCCLTLAA